MIRAKLRKPRHINFSDRFVSVPSQTDVIMRLHVRAVCVRIHFVAGALPDNIVSVPVQICINGEQLGNRKQAAMDYVTIFSGITMLHLI
jgi:hypothetical protein